VSVFKNFNIWWGWWLEKQKALGAFIIFIIMMISALGFLVFVFGFVPIWKEEAIYLIIKLRIIAGISTPIFFYLYINGCGSSSDNNYRIAIDKAVKFAAARPICLARLIQETRETKDPKKLNKWIENWKVLSSQRKKMIELTGKKMDIEAGIPLKEVDIEIEETKRIVSELETKLA